MLSFDKEWNFPCQKLPRWWSTQWSMSNTLHRLSVSCRYAFGENFIEARDNFACFVLCKLNAFLYIYFVYVYNIAKLICIQEFMVEFEVNGTDDFNNSSYYFKVKSGISIIKKLQNNQVLSCRLHSK